MVKNKILNITKSATTTALTVVRVPDHITTPEFNKLTGENFAARLAQANLASKNDIVNFVKKTDFDDTLKELNKKITSIKTKHVFFKNEFKKSQTFDIRHSSFFGQSYYKIDGAQLYLILQPLYYTSKRLGETKKSCIMQIYSIVRRKIYYSYHY